MFIGLVFLLRTQEFQGLNHSLSCTVWLCLGFSAPHLNALERPRSLSSAWQYPVLSKRWFQFADYSLRCFVSQSYCFSVTKPLMMVQEGNPSESSSWCPLFALTPIPEVCCHLFQLLWAHPVSLQGSCVIHPMPALGFQVGAPGWLMNVLTSYSNPFLGCQYCYPWNCFTPGLMVLLGIFYWCLSCFAGYGATATPPDFRNSSIALELLLFSSGVAYHLIPQLFHLEGFKAFKLPLQGVPQFRPPTGDFAVCCVHVKCYIFISCSWLPDGIITLSLIRFSSNQAISS